MYPNYSTVSTPQFQPPSFQYQSSYNNFTQANMNYLDNGVCCENCPCMNNGFGGGNINTGNPLFFYPHLHNANDNNKNAFSNAEMEPNEVPIVPTKSYNYKKRNKINVEKYLNKVGRYECHKCHKSYARYNDLRGHFVIHDETTPSCPFCGKKFSRPVYLRDHIRSHKGEKPYSCHLCARRFTAKRNLTHHLKSHNATTKPCVCNVCEKTFKSQKKLQSHSCLIRQKH